MPVAPLFLLSLPRSGSTLVQRLLSAHEAIATTAEPWFLLPHVYALRKRGVYTEYGHWGAYRALSDFVSGLPGGRQGYEASLRAFALDVYSQAAGDGPTYFLDKTPRYALIARDLMSLFPDAKMVFLWRNPLAVVASIVQTWGGGRWRIHPWRVDLFQGLASLVDAYGQMGDNAYALCYEGLVQSPDVELARLSDFVGVSLASATGPLEAQVHGRFGDQVGSAEYHQISTDSLAKWRDTMCTAPRKAWCRRYLHWIGRDRLAAMGYDLRVLLDELGSCPVSIRGATSDVVGMAYGAISCALELRIMGDKLSSKSSVARMHRHN